MSGSHAVRVRCLASLHTYLSEQGRPASFDADVPAEGTSALELAESLGLPADTIEGVFHNNRIAGVDTIVRPGDRVAFVPAGTPASHPSFFGAFVTRE